MATSKAQRAFTTLVRKDLSAVPFETVRDFALPMWYENFVPDLSKLRSQNEVAKAGYLLERLMAFNCVTPDVRQKLKEKVAQLELKVAQQHPMLSVEAVTKTQTNTDALALRWGVHESLKKQVKELLPYQTRHYKHPHSTA
ncbi:hypothetical protein GCM10009092_45900 [Bowmanella denitrificans]|uniref:Uncharacterized protein n=1 Tax=Bowmanella denitrificans TaxID=366582 RepID=A0ABN0XY90_9ALTE